MCDLDHALIDDSSAQGGDIEDCSVGKDNSNMQGCCHVEMD